LYESYKHGTEGGEFLAGGGGDDHLQLYGARGPIRKVGYQFGGAVLVAVLLSFGLSAQGVAQPRQSAAPAQGGSLTSVTMMAGQEWLIKSNDLQTIGGIGSYEWVGCGETTAPLSSVNYSPCKPGQDPIYTSYATLASDVANQDLPDGSTVIFDIETWTLTPLVEQQNPIEYEQLAAKLALSHNDQIIEAPYAKTSGEVIRQDVAAAEAGASAVDIQAQTLDRDPNAYRGFVRKAVSAIRAVNANIPILAGLATDAGGTPTSAQNMHQEYKSVKGLVQGFWLNANTWRTHAHGCAAQGCPATAVQFLKDIGVDAANSQ
jgi:hypothetical protein